MGADHQGRQHHAAIESRNARPSAEKFMRHASSYIRKCQDLSGRQSERALSAAGRLQFRSHEGAARLPWASTARCSCSRPSTAPITAISIDVLNRAPKGKYRGVGIIDDMRQRRGAARMHAAGIRGARFNFGGAFKLAPSLDGLRRSLARVREIGWFVKVFGFGDDFLAVADELRKIEIPAIVDHMGGPDVERGTSVPVVRLILDLLKNDNWWVGLSNGDLRSKVPYPWTTWRCSAACTTRRRRTAACGAPTGRMCIGSSVPTRTAIPNTASPTSFAAMSLLERYVPDQAARDRVLVDNPARFFGFD